MSEPCMQIVGLTVSLEFKGSTYGGAKVENHFVNLQARVPEGSPGITSEQAMEQSLDLHLAAYESLLSAELLGDQIQSAEFNARLTRIHKRFTKIKAFLKEDPTDGQ